MIISEHSARAVVAVAPAEIVDLSDFGANAKSMGKWCVFVSLLTPNLKIFSNILPDSCVELIVFFLIISILYFYRTISKISYHLIYKKR